MRALGLVFTFLVLCGFVRSLPAMTPNDHGSAAGRYEARGLNWTLVVTQDSGLVEQDLLPYVLTITERPCVDERGRVSPTSVDWAFGLAAHQAAGCGGEIPRAGSKL